MESNAFSIGANTLKGRIEQKLGRELDDYVFEKAIEIADQVLAIREAANQPTSDEGVDRLIGTVILLIENGVEIMP